MRVVYIADDGTEFDDEYECERYEWMCRHAALNDIVFMDETGNRLAWDSTEEFYTHVYTVIISDKSQIPVLRSFVEYTGFFDFVDITDCGTWKWVGATYIDDVAFERAEE